MFLCNWAYLKAEIKDTKIDFLFQSDFLMIPNNIGFISQIHSQIGKLFSKTARSLKPMMR